MILVDTNILIDILMRDADWFVWSKATMTTHAVEGLLINDIVYAELAPRYTSEVALDNAIAEFELTLERVPKSALYVAGRAYADYRKRGGIRTSLLPDFFIGAHAATVGLPIITRDTRRYRAYFPDVTLIAP